VSAIAAADAMIAPVISGSSLLSIRNSFRENEGLADTNAPLAPGKPPRKVGVFTNLR
jgi:hypothetical protein